MFSQDGVVWLKIIINLQTSHVCGLIKIKTISFDEFDFDFDFGSDYLRLVRFKSTALDVRIVNHLDDITIRHLK